MLNKHNLIYVYAIFSLSFLFSESPWYTSSYNDGEIEEIKKKQADLEKSINDINTKLDKVLKVVEGLKSQPQANNKPPTQQKNQRKPADPNYVHNIPQGNSYFIGNPNAKVTITEFFDFQ